MQYIGGRTHTSAALSLMVTITNEYLQVFQLWIFQNGQVFGSSGDRANAPNLALIFTDGNSNIEVDRTIPTALSAKAAGVHVTVFGVWITKKKTTHNYPCCSISRSEIILCLNSVALLADHIRTTFSWSKHFLPWRA
jgi:hypothetical protein